MEFEGVLTMVSSFQNLVFSTFGFEVLSFIVAVFVAYLCLGQVAKHEESLKKQSQSNAQEPQAEQRKDIGTLTSEIRTAVRLGNMPAADNIMQKMVLECGKPGRTKKGCWISCYSDLVHGYIRLGNVQKGEQWLLAFMEAAPLIRPNIACVNSVIHALARAGDATRAEDLLKGVPAVGITMNEFTFCTMIDMYVMKGDKQEAVSWIRKMSSAGMKLKPEHYKIFRQAFQQEVNKAAEPQEQGAPFMRQPPESSALPVEANATEKQPSEVIETLVATVATKIDHNKIGAYAETKAKAQLPETEVEQVTTPSWQSQAAPLDVQLPMPPGLVRNSQLRQRLMHPGGQLPQQASPGKSVQVATERNMKDAASEAIKVAAASIAAPSQNRPGATNMAAPSPNSWHNQNIICPADLYEGSSVSSTAPVCWQSPDQLQMPFTPGLIHGGAVHPFAMQPHMFGQSNQEALETPGSVEDEEKWNRNQQKNASQTGTDDDLPWCEPERSYLKAENLVGFWTGPHGECYNVIHRRKGVWSCTRSNLAGKKEFTIVYDAHECIYWWGSNKRFFLSACEVLQNPSSVTWYNGGKNWRETRPVYQWQKHFGPSGADADDTLEEEEEEELEQKTDVPIEEQGHEQDNSVEEATWNDSCTERAAWEGKTQNSSEEASWNSKGQDWWNSQYGWREESWPSNDSKSWWGKESSSWDEHKKGGYDKKTHGVNLAKNPALLGLWDGPRGEVYEVWGKGSGCWGCIRSDTAVSSSREFNILYDTTSNVYWWGVNRKFFLSASEVVENPEELTWYLGGSSWEQWKPMYKWYKKYKWAQEPTMWKWKAKVQVEQTEQEAQTVDEDMYNTMKWVPKKNEIGDDDGMFLLEESSLVNDCPDESNAPQGGGVAYKEQAAAGESDDHGDEHGSRNVSTEGDAG